MSDAPAAAPASPKKTAKKATKPKAAATHPSFKELVIAAIKADADRKGTSLQAIKKYITTNYPTIEETKIKTFVKKAVNGAVEKGTLVHVGNKGTGASGRFKLNSETKEPKKPAAKKPAAKKPAAKAKKPKATKPKAKKPAAKKSPAKAKKAAKSPKKAAAKPAKKAKTPAKKAAKKPAAKKTPKAKKAAKK